jgi:hypothetical protein
MSGDFLFQAFVYLTRRRDRSADRSAARAWCGARLSVGRRRHRAVRPRAARRGRRRYHALCRVWCGDDALSCRAGTGAVATVAAARADPGAGRAAGRGDDGRRRGHRPSARSALATGAGRRHDLVPLIHRHRAAKPQRARTAQDGGRTGILRRAALSRHRRDPDAGDLPAAGRGGGDGRRCPRRRQPRRHDVGCRAAALGADTGRAGGGGRHHPGRALSAAPGFSRHRRHAAARTLRGDGAAAGGRHCAA